MSETNEVIVIYTTFPEKGVAQSISRVLIEEKLAACINLLPEMLSIYQWEGVVEEAHEVAAFVKTQKSKKDSLIEKIKELHPYDIPAILELSVEGGEPAFLTWVQEQTTS